MHSLNSVLRRIGRAEFWFETFMQQLLPLTWETVLINKQIKHDMIIPDIISIEGWQVNRKARLSFQLRWAKQLTQAFVVLIKGI